MVPPRRLRDQLCKAVTKLVTAIEECAPPFERMKSEKPPAFHASSAPPLELPKLVCGLRW
jgi:hypothetical protein